MPQASGLMWPEVKRLGRVVRLLDRGLRPLKADLAVCTVAEWLVDRTATAAERKCRLAGEIVFVSVSVNHLNGAFRTFDAVRTVGPNRDFDCCHHPSITKTEMLEDNTKASICDSTPGRCQPEHEIT